MYVYKKTHLIENSSILAAAFVPHLQAKRNSTFGQWQQKSQLFFFNSNQVRKNNKIYLYRKFVSISELLRNL